MMPSRILMPFIIFVMLMGYFSIYRVYQWEQAIVFTFREIEHSTSEPGLHMLIPFVNTVQKFEIVVEMPCHINNGGPTRNAWMEADKDSRSQLLTTPPGMCQVNRPKDQPRHGKRKEFNSTN